MYLILQNNPGRSANGSVPDAEGGGVGEEVIDYDEGSSDFNLKFL